MGNIKSVMQEQTILQNLQNFLEHLKTVQNTSKHPWTFCNPSELSVTFQNSSENSSEDLRMPENEREHQKQQGILQIIKKPFRIAENPQESIRSL